MVIQSEASEREKQKWELVRNVSKASNRYGDKIDEMLSESGVTNTQQLTLEQAIRYCERHGIKS